MDESSQAERGQALETPGSKAGQLSPDDQLLSASQHRGHSSPNIEESKIITSNDICKVSKELKGWPRAAALQGLSYNLSPHRRHDKLWHRILLDEQSKIARMEKILSQLDNEDGKDNLSQLQEQAFGRDRHLLSHSYCSSCKHALYSTEQKHGDRNNDDRADPKAGPEQAYNMEEEDFKHHLIEAIHHTLKHYSECVLLIHELKKLPPTNFWEWSGLYGTFEREGLLEGNAWDFLSFQDDFSSTRSGRADQTFATLIYGDALSSRLFRWIFKDRTSRGTRDPDKHNGTIHLNTGAVESLKNGLVAVASGVILIVPIGILLLKPMDEAKSLVVVLCFSALFIFILAFLGKKLDTMLFAASAYAAVLVTFLANMQEGSACQCQNWVDIWVCWIFRL